MPPTTFHLYDIYCSTSMWTLASLGFIVANVGLIVYRLRFHPLAKFPGPRIAAATQWYEAYYEFVHDKGAAFTPRIRQLHAKYGPIVRIGPNELSVDDAEFHDKLYSPQPAVRDRHPHFSSSLGTTKGSFSTVDHHIHRHRRIAYSGFFASSNVMASEPMLRTQIEALCNRIETCEHHDLDLKTLFAAFSFDTFYIWAFGGEPLRLLDDLRLAAYLNETVEKLVTGPAALVVRLFPWVIACARTIPHWVLEATSKRMGQVFALHAIIAKAADDFVRNHRSGVDGLDDKSSDTSGSPNAETLFTVITKSKAPSEEKEASRMAQEGTEMFMAAYTPGRTLLTALYYLHARPAVLETLRKELDSVNPDRSAIIDMRTLESLPYLRAVMKETLRITFPVGSRLPLIAREDMAFKDWIIPASTPVSVNHRGLLFNPDVFPEPLEFKPERWLEAESPINEKRYYVPFGKGGRACPGKEFARLVIQTCLATIVRRFDFELLDTTWNRDIRVNSESLLVAPSKDSNGIRFTMIGQRYLQDFGRQSEKQIAV